MVIVSNYVFILPIYVSEVRTLYTAHMFKMFITYLVILRYQFQLDEVSTALYVSFDCR